MSTLVKSYNFDTAQSWSYVVGGDESGAWQSSGGNSGGCFSVSVSGRNNAGTGYIELVTTWESLGVSASSIINEIDASSFDWICDVWSADSDNYTVGALSIHDNSGTLQATLISSQAGTGSTSYATKSNSSPVSIPAAIRNSNTTIRIRLYVTVDNGNAKTVSTGVKIDNIGFTIDYSVAAIDLSINDSSHGLISDNVSLTQVHSLSIGDSEHGLISDNLELSQNYNLSIDDASHGQICDNIDISVSSDIVVDDSVHDLSSDGIILTQEHNVLIQDSDHSLGSNNIDLIQSHSLQCSDCSHELTSDNISLDSTIILDINDSSHVLNSDNIELVQESDLIINDSTINLSSDNIELSEQSELLINDSIIGLSSDDIELVQQYELEISNCSHNLSNDGFSIVQLHLLIITSTSHGLSSDSIIISEFEPYEETYSYTNCKVSKKHDADTKVNKFENVTVKLSSWETL
jgi:hypothetical protein